MMCFKHLLPYALLLPVPSASPIFVLIFAFQVFYTVRPCGYCLALISILFISSSPSSPFTSLTPTSNTTAAPDDSTLDLIAPTRKTWFDLNHGYLFDPVIQAFSPNATLPHDHQRVQSQTDGYRSKRTVPPGYLDLRYKGLGFVLDLGWRRTEEGTRWEMEDRRISQGVLDQRNRDENAGEKAKRDSQTENGASERRNEDEDDSVLLGSRKSWKDRMLGLVKGKSTNGMLGDW